MRRVVVFIGGSRDALAAVQRTLPTCVRALGNAGVLVPRAGRRGTKVNGFSHQPLTGGRPGSWASLRAEVQAAPGDTVLLALPGLLRAGGEDQRRRLIALLSDLADEIHVVSVISDQLTMINDFYLNQVTTWRTSKRLESNVSQLINHDIFRHETQLRPWYDDKALQLVAVPLPELLAGHPVEVILRAAGVELAPLPESAITMPPKLGSVGVEANRLLATYVRAEIPGFRPDDVGVAATSRAALDRAETMGWCADAFWGWTGPTAARAVAHFEAANRRFARAVWGTEWPISFPVERPCTQVDVLDLDVQVVEGVQRYVMIMATRVAQERVAPR